MLPDEYALETTLRCPRCQRLYVIGEMLIGHSAVWEVVEAVAAGEEGIPLPGPAEEVVAFKLPSDPTPSPAALETTLAVSRTVSSEARPLSPRRARGNKRSPGSPLWSLLSIVGGGLAAFPLALLILWYGLGRDVADLGPQVAEYAPWIVPRQFHPVHQPADHSPPTTPVARQASAARMGASPEPSGLPRPGQSQSLGADAARASLNDSADTPAVADSTDFAQPAGAVNQPAAASVPLDFEEPHQAAEAESRVVHAESPQENLFTAIRDVEDLLDACAAALREQLPNRRELSLASYSSLAGLSEALVEHASAGALQRTVRQHLRGIGRRVSEQAELQRMLDQGARYWIAQHPSSRRYALVMIWEVAEVQAGPEYWQVTGVAPPLPSVHALVPVTTVPPPEPGQRWLLLGELENSGHAGTVSPVLRAQFGYLL